MIDDLDFLRQKINSANKVIEAPKVEVDREAAAFARVEKGLRERDEYISMLLAQNEQLREKQEVSDEKERLHRHETFGSSSERTARLLDDGEGDLTMSQLLDETCEPTIEQVIGTQRKRGVKRKGKREQDLSALEQDPVVYELPEVEQVCPICGGQAKSTFNEHVRYEINRIPERWVVREIRRQVYGCDTCRSNGRKAPCLHAAVPAALFKGSLATPVVLSFILEQKFMNGLPLDRIVKMLERDGIYLSTTNLSRWVNKSAILFFEPLVRLMHEEMLKEDILHIDESAFQVNHEPGRAASTKSFMWLAQTGKYAYHPIILLAYYMTRQYANAKELLNGFKGFLICDGYGAYHDLPEEIIPVGCWEHAREKFAKAIAAMGVNQRTGSPAEKGLDYINRVFSLEVEYSKDEPTPDKRLEARHTRSRPVSDEFFEWAARMTETQQIAQSENLLAKAVRYAVNQRPYLENIYLDGRLEISNNRAENTFVHFAIGRNNWRFADTVIGAQSLAIHYTIMLTARANGLHPRKYVQLLLEKLPTAKISELRDYLPWSDKLPDSLRLPDGQAKPITISLE